MYPSISSANSLVSSEYLATENISSGTPSTGREPSLSSEMVMFVYSRLFSLNHSRASWMRLWLTHKKPGIVLWGKFFGPTKVMPMVEVRMAEEGGITWLLDRCAIWSVLRWYVETLPHKPLWRPDAQLHVPFFLGYSLTMYAAGKKQETKRHSGRVSTLSSSGTSPIHIPFASDIAGVLFFLKSSVQELQMLAITSPLASTRNDKGVIWRSIPSVSFCAVWGIKGANLFLSRRLESFASYISSLKKVPAQTAQVTVSVALLPVVSINLEIQSHRQSSNTISKKGSWNTFILPDLLTTASPFKIPFNAFTLSIPARSNNVHWLGVNNITASSNFVQERFSFVENVPRGKTSIISCLLKHLQRDNGSIRRSLSIKERCSNVCTMYDDEIRD